MAPTRDAVRGKGGGARRRDPGSVLRPAPLRPNDVARPLGGARRATGSVGANAPPRPPRPLGQTITWGGGLVVAQLPRNYPRPPPSPGGRALLCIAAIGASTSPYYLHDNYPPMST